MKSKNEMWLFLQATSLLSFVAILYKMGTIDDTCYMRHYLYLVLLRPF